MFETGAREPVALPRCGHTFCRLCLCHLQKLSSSFRCPACRSPHTSPPVHCLPTNFIVMHLLESLKKVREVAQERRPWLERCPAHGDPHLLWCCQCDEQLCAQCLVEQHMMHVHIVPKTRPVIEEKKQNIMQQTFLDLGYAEDKYLLKEVENIVFQLVGIYRKSRAMGQRMKKERILCTAADCHDLHIHTKHGEVLNHLQTEDATASTKPRKSHQSCSRSEDERVVISTSKCRRHTPLVNKDNHKKAVTNSLEELEASGHDLPKWPLTLEVMVSGQHCPRFWPRFIVQLAAVQLRPKVFLRLGVGVRGLGCVHIRLWGHLRRAQHFLALCLGTHGPCYRGATFRSVERRGEPGESLRGGDYLSTSGASSSCQGVMQNLEWGGRHAGPVKQGLIGGGGGGHHESDALFNICLKDKPGGKMSCPFGEVVSGLGVVWAATRHNPLTEVLIMDAGLVLPHHHSCIGEIDS
ncbi:uncharacterized protein [Panulirus ornatus]